MSTQRIDSQSDIIGSQPSPSSTVRGDGSVVSSDATNSQAVNIRMFPFNGKEYQVIRMIASSGEAEVYEVSDNEGSKVLKYYFSNYKPKDEIIGKLRSIKRDDVIVPLEYGYYQDRFMEINEYMSGGTLGDILPLRDTRQIRSIVRQLVEVIHACHQHHIIHRDIKPVNVFFRTSDKSELVLGDFGISSALQAGENYRMTTSVARTNTYAAPELFTNINNQTTLDYKVDFYALGISILEMWMGEDPFQGISQFNIMRIKTEGRVMIPKEIPHELEQLIKGLITTEPPKRWGYEQVIKWLNGEHVQTHYQTHEIEFKPYEFDAINGITVANAKELAYYMERDRKKAAKQLYSGSIVEWIKPASQDLYSEVYDIVENSYKGPSEENVQAGITKTIYLLDPDRAFKSFDGTEWPDPVQMGAHIEQNQRFFSAELLKPHAGLYLFLEARGLQERADKYRKYFTELGARKALWLVVLDLQENKLHYEGMVFENVSQVTSAPEPVQQQLVDSISQAESKASVWIDSSFSTLSDSVSRWRQLNNYTLSTLRYALRTSGFVIGDAEVNSEKEFADILGKNFTLLTTDPNADNRRVEADYWLTHYQSSSLLKVFREHLRENACSYAELRSAYQYILERRTDVNPFSVAASLAKNIRDLTENNDANLGNILEVSKVPFAASMNAKKQKVVFALDALTDIMGHIEKINAVYPAFAKRILLSLSEKMQAFVHEDLSKMKGNSDTVSQYLQSLSQFSARFAAMYTDIPCYQHWQAEQKLIAKRSDVIIKGIDEEKRKEEAVINSKFSKFLRDSLQADINYVVKGKRFFSTFMILISIFLCCYLYFLSTMAPEMTIPKVVMWSAAILIVCFLIVRNANRRPEFYGMGKLFDPVHRLVGRLLYRPIVRKLRKDPDSPANAKVNQSRVAELQKSAERIEGKKANLLFEEKVRILLLDDEQLGSELRKSA